MTWSVILDPAVLASAPPANRTQLDLNSGSILVDQRGIDWGDSQIQTYMADRRVGSIKIDFRMPNRKVTIPLFLSDDPDGVTEEQARAQLQQKVGLFQMRGGWLMRQRAGGPATYADIMDAVLTLPDVWGETGAVEPNINLILECSPDFYGDETTADLAVVSGGVLSGPLQQGGANAVIQGNHLGRASIIVSDTSGNNQSSLIWGFRSTYYDPAPTAALMFEAESLDPVSPTVVTTVAGRLGVQNTSLVSSGWTPLVNTNVNGISPATHIGSYRVRARVYTTSTTVWLRLVWGVGAAIGLITNNLVKVPAANNFFIVDLGEIRVDYPPIGTLRWEGQIQGQGASGGENVFIDQVYLQPLDDAAGYCVANPSVVALSSPQVADFFNQTAGDLNGQAPAVGGGTWSEPVTGATPPTLYETPTIAANGSGAGTQAWAGSGGVGPPTGAVAATVSLAATTGTQYYQVSGFGFVVPSTATIVGISIDIQRYSNLTGVVDMSSSSGGHPGVVLQNGGTILGTDHSLAGNWPTTPGSTFTYGGPTDLWGATLTPAIVNSSSFGFSFAAYNGSGSTVQVQLTNADMIVYYTVPGSLNFQVDAVDHMVTRQYADSNDHLALAGPSLTATDVSCTVGFASYVERGNAGVVARYHDPNNWVAGFFWIFSGSPMGAIRTMIGGVHSQTNFSTPAEPVWPSMFPVRLVVNTAGQIQLYINGVLTGTVTDANFATGGALDHGTVGLFNLAHTTPVATYWDKFVAYSAASGDAVVFGHSSASLRFDGMYRADPSGTYFGPIASVVGDLPRVPPSGMEDRPVELFLLLSQGDLASQADLALGSFNVQLRYRPVYIHRA